MLHLTKYLLRSSDASHPIAKLLQIASLNVDAAWPSEPTDHSLASLHRCEASAAAGPFDRIVAAPSNKMAVVNDVLLALLKLRTGN